jgi:hypothetical protein
MVGQALNNNTFAKGKRPQCFGVLLPRLGIFQNVVCFRYIENLFCMTAFVRVRDQNRRAKSLFNLLGSYRTSENEKTVSIVY